MAAVMVRLPNEAGRSPARVSPLSHPTKIPKGNPSRSRPFSLLSGEKTPNRKTPGIRRRSDSPMTSTKQIRTNARKPDSRDLVMEEVKILKRGEAVRPLSPPPSADCTMEKISPCLTDRIGPEPQDLPKPSAKAYAGPAFISSPSPNSLPVPFFLKKAASRGEDVARTLRCLLQIDASL